jgi:F-type H+-transporting ATPase subunit gamma
VVAADRGLCGAYNSSVLREAERSIQEQRAAGRGDLLITVGRKVESYFRYRGHRIDAAFSGFSEQPTYEDAHRVGAAVTVSFLEGRCDRVVLVSTFFRSAGAQEVRREILMPLTREAPPGAREAVHAEGTPGHEGAGVPAAYEFEPSAEGILDVLLPRYVDARLFGALLHAAASEHAARQRAMKAATDNADELITSLSRVMNRARQDAITTEIMEIVGGAEALRQSGGAEMEHQFDSAPLASLHD